MIERDWESCMLLLSILLYETMCLFILHTTSLHWRISLAEDNNWLGSNRRPATQPPKIRPHSRCAGMTEWISIIPEECADPLSCRVAILVRHLSLLTSPTFADSRLLVSRTCLSSILQNEFLSLLISSPLPSPSLSLPPPANHLLP